MKKYFLLMCFILAWAFIVAAQTDAPDLKQKFAEAQKQNAAMLQKYTWKSRTELKVKGESKKVKVEQVRYGPDGTQQKVTIEESSAQQGEQKQGGIGRRGERVKGKVVENKKEEFAELMQKLVVVAQSYAHIPPEKMQAFMQNAQKAPGEGPYAGSLKISGKGVLAADDVMSLWIDQQTMMMRRVEVNTTLDSKPVLLGVDYLQLANGPNVTSKSTLQYPDKQIDISIDAFEHHMP